MVAGAMGRMGEQDLPVIAGEPHNGRRLDAIVQSRHHLRLQPAARRARGADALRIHFRQGLQKVDPPHVCPDHQRLMGKAQQEILVMVLPRRQYDVSHPGKREQPCLNIRMGMVVIPVSMGTEHGRRGRFRKLFRHEQQGLGIDARPEAVLDLLDGTPRMIDRLRAVRVQVNALR